MSCTTLPLTASADSISEAPEPRPTSDLVRFLGRAGRPAWEVVTAVDTLRTAGWRYLQQHRRDDAELNALGQRPRDAVYGRIWADAAAELGAELEVLAPGFIEIRSGAARTRVKHQKVMLDDIVTFDIALDKTLVNRRLQAVGLAVPDHLEFQLAEFERAAAFLAASAGPVVVKPASGAGGASVTAGVRTRSQLLRATLKAIRFYPRLLVERQAYGYTYRLLFLDGVLLDVVRRLPPRVFGDGRSSIAKLIGAENRLRLSASGARGLNLLRMDLDCCFTLEDAGLSLKHVPPAGVPVVVKTVTNQNSPRDNQTLRDGLSPEVVAAAATAVRTVGVRVAGVDIVTPDPMVPLEQANGVILEVNAAPGLHHHYHVADPAGATRVAVPILRQLLHDPAVS